MSGCCTAPAGTRLTVNLNEANGAAFNVWEAKPGLREHRFQIYEPASITSFNVARHVQVDEVANLMPQIGGQILGGPGEYPFGVGRPREARARQLGHL